MEKVRNRYNVFCTFFMRHRLFNATGLDECFPVLRTKAGTNKKERRRILIWPRILPHYCGKVLKQRMECHA